MPSEQRWKEQCPEMRTLLPDGFHQCQLNTKQCVLDTGYPCGYYGDFLKELEEDTGITIVPTPDWLKEFEKEAGYAEWLDESD